MSTPKNYQEFLQLCEKLKKKGVIPIGVAGSDLWHMEYWSNHFLRTDVLSQNKSWLKDCKVGKCSWTDDDVTTMLTHMKELFESGYVNSDWRSTQDASLSYLLARQDVAMVYTGPWTTADVNQIDSECELGWFYVPDDQGEYYIADNQDVYWSITSSCAKDAKKYQAAVKFLKFFYSKSNYTELCRATSTMFTNKETILYETSSVQEEMLSAFENADNKVTAYVGDENTPQSFEMKFLTLLEDYLDSDESVQACQKKIQKQWKVSQKEDES